MAIPRVRGTSLPVKVDGIECIGLADSTVAYDTPIHVGLTGRITTVVAVAEVFQTVVGVVNRARPQFLPLSKLPTAVTFNSTDQTPGCSRGALGPVMFADSPVTGGTLCLAVLALWNATVITLRCNAVLRPTGVVPTTRTRLTTGTADDVPTITQYGRRVWTEFRATVVATEAAEFVRRGCVIDAGLR